MPHRSGKPRLLKFQCDLGGHLRKNRECSIITRYTALAIIGLVSTALAATPCAREAGGETAREPDVLFIAIDDMNDWLKRFDADNPVRAPNLGRLAERGMLFRRAYCVSPACNPSRAAILTGLRPSTSGVYGNHDAWRRLVPEAVTLPRYFRQFGYATRGAGKIFHHGEAGADHPDRPSFEQFFDMLSARAPEHNHNGYRTGNLSKVWFDWGEHTQKMIDLDTVEWVEKAMEQRTDKPLLLAAGIFKPHLPFYAPPEVFRDYPFDDTHLPPTPEDDDASRAHASCPQVFEHDGRWYPTLLDHNTWVYEAGSLYGPWENAGFYHSTYYTAASRYAEDGKRRFCWGFFTRRNTPERNIKAKYGGPMGLGRELVLNAAGELGVRPLPELVAAIRAPAHNAALFDCARPLRGTWEIDAGKREFRCTSEDGGALLLDLPGENPDYYFEAEIVLASAESGADLLVRTAEALESGYRVALDARADEWPSARPKPAAARSTKRTVRLPRANRSRCRSLSATA